MTSSYRCPVCGAFGDGYDGEHEPDALKEAQFHANRMNHAVEFVTKTVIFPNKPEELTDVPVYDEQWSDQQRPPGQSLWDKMRTAQPADAPLIPDITEIVKVQLSPEDRVVIRIPVTIDQATASYLREMTSAFFDINIHRVMVIDSGGEVQVVTEHDIEGNPA